MNDRYQRLFNLSIDLLCVADTNGYFLDMNPTWEKVLGFTVAELKSKPFIEFIHPDDRPKTVQKYSDQHTGGSAINFQNRYLCKDGSYRWLEWVATPVIDGLIYAAARDVTRRTELEQELRKHQEVLEDLVLEREKQLHRALRMEAIGRLAGGIAHDFNNTLSVILSSTDFLLEELPPSGPSRENAREIERAASHAAELTRQLLAFGRRQALQPKSMNLNQWVESMNQILRRILGEDIDLMTKLCANIRWIRADPAQMEQVIVNLAINAKDAMPKGGKLSIETANVDLDAEYARQHADAKTGPHVVLAVTDSGTGMDKAVQAKIFEPFFTTKEEGKGTGLGLSTVYGIVKQSGGNIWVYSEPGKGTTFKLYFPAVDEAEAKKEIPAKDKPVDKQAKLSLGTILVVEDEEMVRNVIKKILSRAGYKVLDVPDAAEALRIGENDRYKVDLLLTDVTMPNVSGPELAKRLAQSKPEMKIIYMSGYTQNAIVHHHGALDPEIHFIEKPFSPAKLLEKVRAVLEEDK
jgi:two-component system, cell cycle sensor histidine kinase and response regulator CckA